MASSARRILTGVLLALLVCITFVGVAGFSLYLSFSYLLATQYLAEVEAQLAEREEQCAQRLYRIERNQRSKRPVTALEEAVALARTGDDVDLERVVHWMERYRFEGLPTYEHEQIVDMISANPNFENCGQAKDIKRIASKWRTLIREAREGHRHALAQQKWEEEQRALNEAKRLEQQAARDKRAKADKDLAAANQALLDQRAAREEADLQKRLAWEESERERERRAEDERREKVFADAKRQSDERHRRQAELQKSLSEKGLFPNASKP